MFLLPSCLPSFAFVMVPLRLRLSLRRAGAPQKETRDLITRDNTITSPHFFFFFCFVCLF